MFKTEYVEDFSEFYKEAKPYFEDHYNTCEYHRSDKQKLDLDLSLFQQMIDLGAMNIFILKEDEDVVGYINVSITPSPLFRTPQAVVDFLYILPEHREKGYTKKAVQEIEKELISQNVFDFNILLPEKDYSEEVAASLGFKKTSNTYTKILGE